jgi:sensor histidine kinase regulating citrate/malate metabolism
MSIAQLTNATPSAAGFCVLVKTLFHSILCLWQFSFFKRLYTPPKGWAVRRLAFTLVSINNAKTASENHENRDITFSIEFGTNFVLVNICNTGIGFPPWIIENVGTPFFSTKSENAGLGLYHAHVLMNAIGGGIILENRNEGGAKVTLQFPLYEKQGKI